MEILPITIAAGETKNYGIGDQYFEIVDSVDPVDVKLTGASGSIESLKGALAGSYAKIAFTSFMITSATAQTIHVLYSSREAGTRRLAGAVSITGTASVSVVNPTPQQGAFTQTAIAVTIGGIQLLAANANRRYCEVINTDAVAIITVTVDGSAPGATANGITLNPGDSWTSPAGFAPTAAVKASANVGATCVVLEG